MPGESVCLTLSAEEAVVMFEFLARAGQDAQLRIQDESERTVLANLLCMLEKRLTAPFALDYAEILSRARESLRRSGV